MKPTKTKLAAQIGDLIDRIEQIREELLSIQKVMERMEPAKSIAVHDLARET
jgi:hypothetical protein